MKFSERRVLISFLGSLAILLVVWLLFWVTDHNYGDLWEGSKFHIAVGFCWLWPALILHPLKLFTTHSWLNGVVLLLLDVLAYSLLVYSSLLLCSKSKRRSYYEK